MHSRLLLKTAHLDHHPRDGRQREVLRRARRGLGRQSEVHVWRAAPQAGKRSLGSLALMLILVRRQEDFDVAAREEGADQEPEDRGEGCGHHPSAGSEVHGQQDRGTLAIRSRNAGIKNALVLFSVWALVT